MAMCRLPSIFLTTLIVLQTSNGRAASKHFGASLCVSSFDQIFGDNDVSYPEFKVGIEETLAKYGQVTRLGLIRQVRSAMVTTDASDLDHRTHIRRLLKLALNKQLQLARGQSSLTEAEQAFLGDLYLQLAADWLFLNNARFRILRIRNPLGVVRYLIEVLPHEHTALGRWLEQQSHMGTRSFFYPDLIFRKGIGAAYFRTHIVSPDSPRWKQVFADFINSMTFVPPNSFLLNPRSIIELDVKSPSMIHEMAHQEVDHARDSGHDILLDATAISSIGSLPTVGNHLIRFSQLKNPYRKRFQFEEMYAYGKEIRSSAELVLKSDDLAFEDIEPALTSLAFSTNYAAMLTAKAVKIIDDIAPQGQPEPMRVFQSDNHREAWFSVAYNEDDQAVVYGVRVSVKAETDPQNFRLASKLAAIRRHAAHTNAIYLRLSAIRELPDVTINPTPETLNRVREIIIESEVIETELPLIYQGGGNLSR